ncbi:HAMP domain-containing sensor histidine kinase [Psychrobacillus sp. FSL W7-1457]|uniref:HAMP domain-containing sensor histidine kinase n=1 Tax=unclassified Psychrobacillus TaxID=2636677 RepID=UPI0030F79015
MSPILGAIVILLRGLHGIDLGFYMTLTINGTLSIALWILSPYFMRLKSKYRIICSSFLALIMSLFILFIVLNTSGSAHTLDLYIAYIVIPPLGIAIITYIIEAFEKINTQRKLLIKVEKKEAVEQMGAAISHEIRNPLTSAIGFVELLTREPLDSEKSKQYLAILKDELDLAEKIIQDYLTYSKPITEHTKEINIQEELPIVLKLLQPLANYYSVKIVSDLSSTSLIDGDRAKFQHTFINIIKNNIVSLTDGGVISITTKETKTNILITITSPTTENQMESKVLDTSIDFGIIRNIKGTVRTKRTEQETTYYFTFRKQKASYIFW